MYIRSFSFLGIFLFLSLYISAQNRISGIIKDANEEPISFVSVVVVGSTLGTYSDIDGKYELDFDIKPESTLKFSYVGYKTQEVIIQNRSVIDIIMNEDAALLDEIVVVGYGVQKRSDVTGAVSKVVVDEAKQVPTTNVAELLRGKSAGVQVSLTDPRPGGTSSILIRGQNSIIGNNEPLYVVDGIPVDNINGVNAEDVASIEILKDASAQAIYGARASNGIVLVTTKRGETGKLKINYHGYRGEQQLTKNFDLFSGEEWAQMRREAYRTDNQNDEYESDEFVFTPLQREVMENKNYVNWEDEVINNATQQNHSISFSGGSEKTTFLTSFGYFDQKGIIPGSAYVRGTARLNMDHKVSDRFTLGSSLYLLTDRTDKESGSLNYIVLPPLSLIRDENGELVQFIAESNTGAANPLWNIRESTDELFSNQFQMNLFGEYELFKNFKYKLNGFVARRNKDGGTYTSRLHSSSISTLGKASLYAEKYQEYLIENIFNYSLEVNANNRFDFTFMQSANQRDYQEHKTTANNFTNDLLGYHGIESAAEISSITHKAWSRRMLSFMGRMRYYLNDKYLLTLTGRRDGSSVFGPSNKWGFFPSVAVAWKAHMEPFVQNLGFINELKVRASYGSIGNEGIQPYQTLGLASTTNYIFDDIVYGGYQPGSALFNPDLKWETSTTLNLGIDFGLLKNFLVGSLELYNTNTKDLLVNRTTPGGTGYTSILSNIGKVNNRGVELSLTANIIDKADLNWSISTTFSKNTNEIIDLFGEVDSLGNLLNDISKKRFIGHPISVIYQYEYDGIWSSSEEIADSHMPDAVPGEIRVKDINGDGTITTDDLVITKSQPDWYGSLSTRVGYKGFDLFVDFYTVQGAVRSNQYLAGFNEGGTLQGGLNGIKRDYWLPENPTGTAPRPRASQASPFIWSSAVQDASYTRLRTVSLAYSLPSRWLKPVKLSNLTIYGTATNLITWTDYLSYSPELNVNSYPDGKSYILGLKINI